MRQVCLTCGSVTIDLPGGAEVDGETMVANRLER
jgi:hypothetical protein